MAGNSDKPTGFGFLTVRVDEIAIAAAGQYGYSPGGLVLEYGAAATLNVGDVVYISGANQVNKSNVAATVLGKVAGVVVGGTRTDMRAIDRKLDVGIQAAQVNERVLVLVYGKFWVVSDAAITAGDPLTPGTGTAGRAKTGTVTTDLVAGDTGRLIGNALELAGGAAVTILASINLH